MYRRYDRFLTVFDARDTSLEGVDVSAQPRCRPRAIGSRTCWVGGEDGVLRGFLDVEAGGEGFGAGAGEDDGAGGGGGGEVGEEGGELVPHSVDYYWHGRKRGNWRVKVGRYSSLKAFILSGRLISTWATKGRG